MIFAIESFSLAETSALRARRVAPIALLRKFAREEEKATFKTVAFFYERIELPSFFIIYICPASLQVMQKISRGETERSLNADESHVLSRRMTLRE